MRASVAARIERLEAVQGQPPALVIQVSRTPEEAASFVMSQANLPESTRPRAVVHIREYPRALDLDSAP